MSDKKRGSGSSRSRDRRSNAPKPAGSTSGAAGGATGGRKGGSGKGGSGKGASGRGASSAGSGSGSSKRTSGAPSSDRSQRRAGKQQSSGRNVASRRSEPSARSSSPDAKRRDLKGGAVHLPRHVVDALARTTPKERVAGALEALGNAVEAFTDGRYHRALDQSRKAKNLAPRDQTVREVLGLSAYRVGDWQTALAELRTYRRLAGDTTHLPIEMDALRALDRPKDVVAAWEELNKRGGSKATLAEGKVVYASHLIDSGDVSAARKLVRPARVSGDPHPAELRVWYVAARAAALDGDPDDARRIADAIVAADPAFPGLDDLERDIRRARVRAEE